MEPQTNRVEIAVSANETFNDALTECVKAAGGSKRVGGELWPSMATEAAQRKLLNSLSEGRPEKLSPDEVLHVIRLARQRGCHAGMQFLAADLCYANPTPVEPRDAADDLQRRILAMGEQLNDALASLTRLQKTAQREDAKRGDAGQLRSAA